MARTTTNYGWNISEGSDLVNPLTDIFPNFESLDTDLKEVSNASIGEATELKTGTVHALTRTDTDKDVFKFTATSNFTAGDTFTVDSEQVSALTTSGEQLTTGCYIIGSEVLVAKKGTLLTFYISNVITDASTLEGHSASYFATASDLNNTNADVLTLSNKVGSAILTTDAQDCSGAINELNTDLSDYDFSKSSMTPTTFHNMIQQILEKTFPATITGTFTTSSSAPTVVNMAVSIRNLRIVSDLDGVATTWKYDSNTPGVCTRKIGGNPVDTYSLPNSSMNTINSVSERSFTMGATSVGSVNCTYYVNES